MMVRPTAVALEASAEAPVGLTSMAVDTFVVLTALTTGALVIARGAAEWSVELEVPSLAV
jgi:hypothetical protein